MSSKKILLTASGLKNLVIREKQDEEFEFIFGQHKISMSNMFAEFISPKVSNIHKSDPTMNLIVFSDNLNDIIFSKEVLSKFQMLASGEAINIKEEENFQMKIISILIGNDELYHNLNDLYSNDINETNIGQYLTNLTILSKISPSCEIVKYSNIISLISSQFYSIDKKKLKELPIEILHSIIANSNLQIENEDSLFDFINDVIDKTSSKDERISLYEQIEFANLSDEKLEEFLDIFDPSDMTNDLWLNLCICLCSKRKEARKRSNMNRYRTVIRRIEYDGKKSHEFNGIIDELTKESGGNVNDNGTVKVTASSIFDMHHPKNVVDFNNLQSFYHSNNPMNYVNWVKFDFVGRKVSPSGYSIRTRPDRDSHHPKSWVIEGTNIESDEDSYWTILDTRNNEKNLTGISIPRTFEIKDIKGSYRFLRIRQTNYNSGGTNNLLFSALEFFGTLIDNQQ